VSSLGKFRKFLIVVILLGLLVLVYVQAATLQDELLVDPTAPLIPVAGADNTDSGINLNDLLTAFIGYELSSILIRENDRVAVINSQRVRVGERVGNARVTAIEPGSVTLNVDGELQTLQLYQKSIKTRVKGEG
jgi:hypothetical protein